MSPNVKVSISGIRAKSPEILDAKLAASIARAFVHFLPEGPIVVSRDSRESGLVLKKAIVQAIHNEGRLVLDADLVPLPTTQIAIKKSGAAGGIDITASHNPAEDNGLKLLNEKGEFPTQEILDKVIEESENKNPQTTRFPVFQKKILLRDDAIEWHLELLRKKVIHGRRLIVALDAVNGAGSKIITRFLREINCEVIPLATDPLQPFPHPAEPRIENLAWTKNKLRGKKYDCCFVVDPDGDRLLLIDEHGKILSEEVTMPIVLLGYIADGKKGTVVINQSTSRVIEDLAAPAGIKIIRSAVGERNVVNMMLEQNALLGGEGGGGVIDPEIHHGRDSLVGILHVLNYLRRGALPLSVIAKHLDRYVMRKVKIPLEPNFDVEKIYESLKLKFLNAKIDECDGVRFDWGKTWIHVRPSNTEPIIRIIGEAEKAKEIDDLIEIARQTIIAPLPKAVVEKLQTAV